jgi:chitodextrinase
MNNYSRVADESGRFKSSRFNTTRAVPLKIETSKAFAFVAAAVASTISATRLAGSGLILAIVLLWAVPAAQAVAADTQAPSVPTGLRATVNSSSQITLTWNVSTDNVAVKGYYVYLNNAPLAITTSLTYKHTGLTAGTTYNYRVSAFDAVPNHSAWTATPVSAKTTGNPPPDTVAPSVPAGLTATVVSNTQVNLSWKASTDNVAVKGYYVYLNDKPLTTTTALSFQHAGLSAGTTYNYRVSAYDAVPNHSAWTATPVSVTTTLVPAPDTTPPSVPGGLTGTVVSDTQINLSWGVSTDNVAVKGYYVYLNDKPLTTTTATSFQHSGLSPGTTYNYRVSAYDAVPNHSAWTATPLSLTTRTSAPAPISSAAQFVATFPAAPFRSDTGDGVSNDNTWWVEQKAGTNRASIVGIGRDGGTALRLHTEPGDNNVSGSGTNERNDISIPQSTTGGYEGTEQWWAHSILFPDDFVTPPAGTWGCYFDFHDTRNQGGQANFDMFVESYGHISVRGHAGPDVVYDITGNQYSYGADFGPVVKNTWYDFVYHVKWSSGSDGYMQAWVNGVLMLDHRGPTLYTGYGVYLKLANYHSATGQASSIIHDRVVRGPTALSVSPVPLAGVLTLANGALKTIP